MSCFSVGRDYLCWKQQRFELCVLAQTIKKRGIIVLEYKLFGKTVVFDDAAERYFDLSQQEHKAEKVASLEFKSWYEEQKSIEKVISEYENYAFNIVKEMAAKPMMKMIKEYQIYDVSVEEYVERCMDGQYIESDIELVEGRFYKIIDNQEAER